MAFILYLKPSREENIWYIIINRIYHPLAIVKILAIDWGWGTHVPADFITFTSESDPCRENSSLKIPIKCQFDV